MSQSIITVLPAQASVTGSDASIRCGCEGGHARVTYGRSGGWYGRRPAYRWLWSSGESTRHRDQSYLLQHADNPVDWWPWCDEAFAETRRRDVPVLISVGYAACHWYQ